jgi:hypothetical protein
LKFFENWQKKFSLAFQKKHNIQFCEICDYKKSVITNFFSPLSFVTVFGSGIRDPGSGMDKNQDPGSGINIPEPPHCQDPNQIKKRWRRIIVPFNSRHICSVGKTNYNK